MRHHKNYRYWFIALILFTLVTTGLLILHFTGKVDLPQFPPARLILLCLLVTTAVFGGMRRRFQRRQQQFNEAAGSQGTLLLLAPHPDIPLESHDFFRRFPAQYVQREGDWPCAHTAFELTGNQFQMRYACFLAEKAWQQAAVKEISHEWRETQIQVVDLDPNTGSADPIRAAVLEGQPAIVWRTLRLKNADVYPLHVPDEPARYGTRTRDQTDVFGGNSCDDRRGSRRGAAAGTARAGLHQ